MMPGMTISLPGERMRRRDFLTLMAGAAASAPLAVWAQESGRTYRIGVLNANPREWPSNEALFDGLRRNGFVEGRNLSVNGHFATPYGRFGAIAMELVKAKVEVILCGGGGPPIRAVQAVTRTIPILSVADDMVAEGL